MKHAVFVLLLLCTFSILDAKVLIITHSFNRPDFIEIQYKTFKRFLKDDYEYVVFIDAYSKTVTKEAKKICKKYGIRYFIIPQEIHERPYLKRWPKEKYHHPSVRTANVIQYSLNTFGFKHDGIVIIIDSDLFLINDFSFTDFMQDYDLAGVPQSRGQHVSYIWNGLVFLNMQTLPNKETLDFNCGMVEGMPVDTAGQTHYYLKNNPQIKKYNISCIHSSHLLCQECRKIEHMECEHNTDELKNAGFNPALIKFIQSGAHNFEILMKGTFLHYRGGGNWESKEPSYHIRKTKFLHEFIDDIINHDYSTHLIE